MTCSEIKEYTVPYLELDLEPERVREITFHLDGCMNCRAEMEAVRQVLVRVKGITVPDPGDQFWSEFPGKVRQELARAQMKGQRDMAPLRRPLSAPSWFRASMWPMALAASVLLFIGAWSLKGLVDKGLVPAPTEQTAVQIPQGSQDLPHPTDADLEAYWEDDPDTVLVDMAARLDQRTVDRLFGDI